MSSGSKLTAAENRQATRQMTEKEKQMYSTMSNTEKHNFRAQILAKKVRYEDVQAAKKRLVQDVEREEDSGTWVPESQIFLREGCLKYPNKSECAEDDWAAACRYIQFCRKNASTMVRWNYGTEREEFLMKSTRQVIEFTQTHSVETRGHMVGDKESMAATLDSARGSGVVAIGDMAAAEDGPQVVGKAKSKAKAKASAKNRDLDRFRTLTEGCDGAIADAEEILERINNGDSQWKFATGFVDDLKSAKIAVADRLKVVEDFESKDTTFFQSHEPDLTKLLDSLAQEVDTINGIHSTKYAPPPAAKGKARGKKRARKD